MASDIEPISAPVHLGALVGSNSTELACFVAETDCVIVGVDLVDITGVTANGTHYGTLTITNKGTSGSGTTVVAERSTDTVSDDDIDAYDAWSVTLSATLANREISAGECLAAKWSEAGDGQDLGGATVVIHYAIGTGAGT